MANLERVHWFLREKCNTFPRCSFCFGPQPETEINPERDLELANILVKNGVREIVLGGGEPTLADNMEEVLKILKLGNVYVSLHTNGSLLTIEKLNRWTGLIDDIALPIDAVNPNIQEQLRGKAFMRVHANLMTWAEEISAREIGVGWHTVFTAVNEAEIPLIYSQIKASNFKYWRIYEYNASLAGKVKALEKAGTPEKGGTDCLLADFLRMEEKMAKFKDNRIQFVARKDKRKEPYAFLRNDGRADFYAWYSGNQRKELGHILVNGFRGVEQRWNNVRDLKEIDEKDWIGANADMPLWARLHAGLFFDVEMDKVRLQYAPEVFRLSKLWTKRNG